MMLYKKIVDCHYCENAMCMDSNGWCDCYLEDGFTVKDSKKEAEECEFFEYCDVFPKT